MAALQAAVALPEVGDRTGAVADQLHLQVAGLLDQQFHIQRSVAECGLRFGRAARERSGQG